MVLREVRYIIVLDLIIVDVDDDFGFGVIKEEFDDNKKCNFISGVDEVI